LIIRFLANARNDRILCGIWGNSVDSLWESTLFPHHTTPIDVVIPNESAIRRRSEESLIKSDCILIQKEIHIICMIPNAHIKFYQVLNLTLIH